MTEMLRNYLALPFALAAVALMFIAEKIKGGEGNTPLFWM